MAGFTVLLLFLSSYLSRHKSRLIQMHESKTKTCFMPPPAGFKSVLRYCCMDHTFEERIAFNENQDWLCLHDLKVENDCHHKVLMTMTSSLLSRTGAVDPERFIAEPDWAADFERFFAEPDWAADPDRFIAYLDRVTGDTDQVIMLTLTWNLLTRLVIVFYCDCGRLQVIDHYISLDENSQRNASWIDLNMTRTKREQNRHTGVKKKKKTVNHFKNKNQTDCLRSFCFSWINKDVQLNLSEVYTFDARALI